MTQLQELDRVFKGRKRLVAVMHDYPDPDAIASAFALSHLSKERYGIPSQLLYGGAIQRAENLALVRELHIRLTPFGKIKIRKDDCVAVIDSQPGAGNNSISRDTPCDLIVDHHPKRRSTKSAHLIIDTSVGASATIFVELLEAAGLTFPVNLATALAYAIRTETQELGRETSKRDIRAYLAVYSMASMKKLSRIAYPKLPHLYFEMLANGLSRARYFRNLVALNLGPVHHPEIVAELADILLRRSHTSWVICSGRYQDNLFVSVRSSNPKARAGKLIRRIIRKQSDSGGHDTFAGGRIAIKGLTESKVSEIEKKLIDDFAAKLGVRQVDWKPLIGEPGREGAKEDTPFK